MARSPCNRTGINETAMSTSHVLAEIYAKLGDKEKAFALLEKA